MSAAPYIGENAADDLLGKELNGWKVVEKVGRIASDTGGYFSITYRVERDGRSGYCKVLNYYWILQISRGDPLEALSEAVNVYQFERDLARQCRSLSRVITSIDDGSIRVPGYRQDLVSYIIFEVAECDVRRLLNTYQDIQVAVKLRLIHHLAVALRQLHGQGIAHQDVKPSNLLVFPADMKADPSSRERSAKVGDLGRATSRSRSMPHDDLKVAGALAYAPVEALYGQAFADFGPRRLACDLYQLGSMIYYLFTTTSLNARLQMELHPAHSWSNWTGSYEEVLPYVRDALSRSFDALRAEINLPIAEDIVRLVAQLCEPEVSKRGHRVDVSRSGNSYSLQRIITELDRLATRASVLVGSK